MGAGVFDAVRARLAGAGREFALSHATLAIEIAREEIFFVARELKDAFAFDILLDVTAVDWPGRSPRFEVVWHFYSNVHFVRVRVKTRVALEDPVVDSLAQLYGSANFAERECHDMYGIVFRGNPDLRPILLYEGFAGHPLRKDYPKGREQPLVPYRK